MEKFKTFQECFDNLCDDEIYNSLGEKKLIQEIYESENEFFIITKEMIENYQPYTKIDIKDLICEITEHYLY